jgi:hypothetical protein
MRFIISVLWVTWSASAALAQSDCPPSGFPLSTLNPMKLQGWKLADADRRQSLALGLLPCLSHPDPALRDGIALDGLSAMMRGKLLTPETLYQVYRIQLVQLQSKVKDADGFSKPFAALALAEVARADRLEPFLEPVDRVNLVNVATEYMRGISDYRGFDTVEGWRHGVAHGADLLMQLALNRAITVEQLDSIVRAAQAQIVAGQSHFYIYGESDRLARPIVFAARRGQLDAAYWQRVVDAVASPAPLASWGDAFDSQTGLARLHNTKSFLRAFLQLATQLNDPEVNALLLKPLNAALLQMP